MFLALVINGITVASDDTTLQTLEFNQTFVRYSLKTVSTARARPKQTKSWSSSHQRQSALDAGVLDPSELIIDRIHSNDSDLLMPPPDSNRYLSQRDKKMLTRWIHEGATYQTHWAFVAPVENSAID